MGRKEQPVSAPSDRKGNCTDTAHCTSSEPLPVISRDLVWDTSPDPVLATPTKRTRTRVVKPPKRFGDCVRDSKTSFSELYGLIIHYSQFFYSSNCSLRFAQSFIL